MKDDYLWDGTGEPDPEVERLEQMLSVYKYQPKKLDLPARPTVWFSPRLAAAAAIVMMAIAGLLVYLNKGEQTPPIVAKDNPVVEQPGQEPGTGPRVNPDEGVKDKDSKPDPTVQEIAKSPRTKRAVKRVERVEPDNIDVEVGGLAYFDLETAKHLEKAQMLLRSFKNVSLESDDYVADASYEKQLSKSILQEECPAEA